ncbi:MAG: hypothetical protein KDA60_13420 [Planctomycetales bacterium]|nr:hypothetical protein [Planctomycetales bacterium]
MAIFGLVLGVVTLNLSSPWRNEVFVPGSLSEPHAQILDHRSTERCESCHAAAQDGLAQWLISTVSWASRPAESQSLRCLECHEKSFARSTALFAHNMTLQTRESLTKIVHDGTGLTHTRRSARLAESELACSLCHQEHQGRTHDLTAMSDRQCQVCHTRTFESFENGHPEFQAWPQPRAARVSFDHRAHYERHFAQKQKQLECQSCHGTSNPRDVIATKSYEVTCAECHDEPLRQFIAKSIPVLSLPMLDVDHLAGAGHNIGSWPALATGDFDGPLPELLWLLLSADPATRRAAEVLGPRFDWIDIDLNNQQQLAATKDLVWALKQLMYDVATQGHQAIQVRLERALGRPIAANEIEDLTAQMPVELFGIAAGTWFTDLETELAQQGRVPSTSTGLRTLPEITGDQLPSKLMTGGGWFRDSDIFAIKYRPAGHADVFTAAWLSVLAEWQHRTKLSLPLYLDFLTHNAGVKQCVLCHAHGVQAELDAANTSPEERLEVIPTSFHWASTSVPRQQSLTFFTHVPHLTLPQLASCDKCHALVDGSESAATGEFETLHKGQCVTCHTATSAGDSCVKCHNYHLLHLNAEPG